MRAPPEAIPQMERGVASRGGVSQPLAVGARHPPSGHYTTGVRGVRWDRSGRKSGEGKARARPKIATVERREASVSRETRAPHTRPWARRKARSAGAAAPARYLGAPPPLISGARSQKQNPGAKTRRGNEETCAV